MSREYTNGLLDSVAQGLIDKDYLIIDLLGFMSEDDVKEFCQRNDYFPLERYDHVEVDESMDGDEASALASAGFGTDEDYGLFDTGFED